VLINRKPDLVECDAAANVPPINMAITISAALLV
jgi:hypothetical protein